MHIRLCILFLLIQSYRVKIFFVYFAECFVACSSVAICPGGCIPNAECVSPSLCRCLDGFTGPKCKWTSTANRQHGMRPSQTGDSQNEVKIPDDISSMQRCRCLNGGRCVRNRCKCLPGFTGPRCRSGQHTFYLHLYLFLVFSRLHLVGKYMLSVAGTHLPILILHFMLTLFM